MRVACEQWIRTKRYNVHVSALNAIPSVATRVAVLWTRMRRTSSRRATTWLEQLER